VARRSFKDRFLTPPVARAMMSPLGIVLAGAAAAGAVLVGAPIAIAAGAAALAWGGRVLVAVPRDAAGQRIEPSMLSEPWRTYVEEARSAKQRYDRVVADLEPGPMRDRLASVGARLEDGVRESWRISRHGHEITDALSRLDTVSAQTQLAELRASARTQPPTAATQRTIASLEAQIESARRMHAVADDARDRLRLLDARLDELVARAVEVSVGTADSTMLGNDVDELVVELEALRMAVEETNEAAS
jgi:hypothetical protein